MRTPRSPGWYLLLTCLGVCVLITGTVIFVRISNQARLKRQLEEIAQRGEPVELSEGVSTEGGQATLAWVKQFQDCAGENDEWSLLNRDALAALLALPESEGISGEDRARVQRLSACLAPGSAWDEDGLKELADHARALLEDGLPEEQWDECSRDWVLSRDLCYRPVQALLAGPIPSEPLDLEHARGVERVCKEIYALTNAVRGLLAPADACVAKGDSGEVLRRVRAARKLEALFSRQPGQISLLVRDLISRICLHACEVALAQLPPDVGLEDLGPLFDSCGDERAEFRRALLEDRAIGNEIYADYGTGSVPAEPGIGSLFDSVMTYDRPYFLETHERLLACLDRSSLREVSAGLAEVQAGIEQHFASWRRYTAIIASMLLSRYAEPWRSLVERRARIELVRAGLRARTLAPEAALAEARRGRDPFDEGELHARLDPDGLLTLWSVGPNGVDDGGPTALERERREVDGTACDDLVVRVRLR